MRTTRAERRRPHNTHALPARRCPRRAALFFPSVKTPPTPTPRGARRSGAGRRARLTMVDALGGETLRTHHVGLIHRETPLAVVALPCPGGLISAISTAHRGSQHTVVREHLAHRTRTVGMFEPPTPIGAPRIWALDLLAPGLLGGLGRGGELTLSLLTGHLTNAPPLGVTTPIGQRLTWDGALLDLHSGEVRRPFGPAAQGEALWEEDGALWAVTREGDTVTWWRVHREEPPLTAGHPTEPPTPIATDAAPPRWA